MKERFEMQMRFRTPSYCLVVTMLSGITLGWSVRQWCAAETAKPEAAKKTSAESGSSAARSGQEDFQTMFSQWKSLLEELRRLVEEYLIAEPARRAEIVPLYRQQWQKSQSLLPRLVEAAETAYQQAPEPQKELQDFLLAYCYERVGQDDYEIAYRIGSLLLQRGCKDRRLTNMTAYAAFCVNQYDEAWRLFQKAKQEGTFRPLDRKDVLNATVEEFLKDPEPFRQAWQRELQFREAEQKADNLPRVRLRTNRGDIVVELFEDQAPNTTANFVSLVERGFYNGVTFHRVIEGFMAQGGCPKGDGTGGPGYQIACECYQPNRRQHFRGVLSMAHAGRDTGGSQFFITFVPTPHLDSRIDPQTGQPEPDPQTGRPYVGHTVFGRVIEGMEVLAKIQRRSPTNPDAPPADKILKAVVLRKRPHPYVPKKIEPDQPDDQPDTPPEKGSPEEPPSASARGGRKTEQTGCFGIGNLLFPEGLWGTFHPNGVVLLFFPFFLPEQMKKGRASRTPWNNALQTSALRGDFLHSVELLPLLNQ